MSSYSANTATAVATEDHIRNHYHTMQVIADNIRLGRVCAPPADKYLTAAEHDAYVGFLYVRRPKTQRDFARRNTLAAKWRVFRDLTRCEHIDEDESYVTRQHARIYNWMLLCAITADPLPAVKQSRFERQIAKLDCELDEIKRARCEFIATKCGVADLI